MILYKLFYDNQYQAIPSFLLFLVHQNSFLKYYLKLLKNSYLLYCNYIFLNANHLFIVLYYYQHFLNSINDFTLDFTIF